MARNERWSLIMRIEDLDTPRIKAGAANQVLDTMRWLGLDFDGKPLVQSENLAPYHAALEQLLRKRLAYPCTLTRREIEAASSAPHDGEHELRFGPELRPSETDRRRTDPVPATSTNYRMLTCDLAITIDDQLMGRHVLNPFREVGDFVIWTKRGVPAYQLAVVVDDARQGVTDVVRGADLLPSAARQELLYRALDLTPPRWWHLPLVIGQDGRRLAKRHGDTRIDAYREQGVPPQRIIGLLAFWSGVLNDRAEMSAHEFRMAFKAANLPSSPITFTQDDHQWLLAR